MECDYLLAFIFQTWLFFMVYIVVRILFNRKKKIEFATPSTAVDGQSYLSQVH